MTAAATAETFDPAAIMGLPGPARRWLGHAIAPGTPLWSSVELTMHGQIKLGRWRPFTWQFGDDTEAAELLLKPNGRLAEVRISRWGNPGGAPFRRYPFGVRVEAESRFGGITIPSVFRAAWHESEFFRAEITGAVFS
jgi:hypothetical protein